jgi:hypothetical protein
MKIRFSIWRDQQVAFSQLQIEQEIAISIAEGSPYRGWLDFNAEGRLDELFKYFHALGKMGFNIHIFKDNPVT